MQNLAATIAAAGNPGAVLRTGRIVYLDAAQVQVSVAGGDPVTLACPRGSQLMLGDYVQVLLQGSVGWILGAADGIPQDAVLVNPGFELDAAGSTTITSWTVYADPSAASTATVEVSSEVNFALSGTNTLTVEDGSNTGSNTYVYSEPIPVHEGQLWTAAAGIYPYISGTLAGSGVQLILSWYDNPGTGYPGTDAADTILDGGSVPLGGVFAWSLLRQRTQASGVVVPAGISWMRVVLNTEISGPGSVDWDNIICRRIDS